MPFVMTLPATMTVEDLERMGRDAKFLELWKGEPRVGEPAPFFGALVGARITTAINVHPGAAQTGYAVDGTGGFVLRRDPDTVLAPDVAYVRHDQWESVPPRGFAPLVPPLVAEVRSPRNSWPAMLQRGGIWIGFGVDVVWLVDPIARRALTMRPDEEPVEVDESGALCGEPVLDGLRIPLVGLFERIGRADEDAR
jgi:Uma2 family endonuclease